jgi:DNA polymerase III epsilon subunit-like protein
VFVALDVETTGFSPRADRVLELALVRFKDGVAEDELALRMNPGRAIPRVVSALTGIAAADVRSAPRFATLAPRVVSLLTDARCLVAYNAPFDRRFLAAELRRAGHALPSMPWIDVLALAREVEPRARSFALANACARHGVGPFAAHRAGADARAAGELLLRLADRADAGVLARHVPKEAWVEPRAPLGARVKARVLSLFH